jgi:hypothetical protein
VVVLVVVAEVVVVVVVVVVNVEVVVVVVDVSVAREGGALDERGGCGTERFSKQSTESTTRGLKQSRLGLRAMRYVTDDTLYIEAIPLHVSEFWTT